MGRELETVIWLSGQWEIGFEAGYNPSPRPAHLKNARNQAFPASFRQKAR